MRLALLSDIHGNPIALEAVLADIAAVGGVDEHWILGDLAALGYAPANVLARLAGLPNVRFLRGNTDRYLLTGERPPPSLESVYEKLTRLPRLVEVASTFAWTNGYLAATGWLDWLAGLPLEQRTILPDGTRLLCVHASPGRDDGDGIHPRLSDGELAALLFDAQADLVCVGHTHLPLDRSVGGVRVINLGSVSNPVNPDLRAAYVLLDADAAGCRIQPRRVPYDVQAVIHSLERSRHPARAYLISFFRGERKTKWSVP